MTAGGLGTQNGLLSGKSATKGGPTMAQRILDSIAPRVPAYKLRTAPVQNR